MGKFRELKVWQKAKDLAVYLYKLTMKGAFAKDYGLRDQIRRAGVSIPSNIAEGDEFDTNKQAIKFFYIAKGSSAEVLIQAIIALMTVMKVLKREGIGQADHATAQEFLGSHATAQRRKW